MFDKEKIQKIAANTPSDIDAITQTIYDAASFSARAAEYIRGVERNAPEGAQNRYLDAMLTALRGNIKSSLILAAKMGILDAMTQEIDKRIDKSCKKIDEKKGEKS